MFSIDIKEADTKGPYAATYKSTRQISEDEWVVIPQILKLRPETTVEDILRWWCEKNIGERAFDGPIIISKMEED